MNYLVFLDAQTGELEKILSEVKTMVLKEFDPAHPTGYPVSPGDNLYFLRNNDDCSLRVKATVVRVSFSTSEVDQDLSYSIKEMQSKLHLTEDQYNDWSAKGQAQLVEFGSAQKIGVIQVASERITDRSDWIPFEEFSQIIEEEVSDERQAFNPRW
jgi:hypothetical protein